MKWVSRIVGLLVCIIFFVFAITEVLPAFRESGSSASLFFMLLLSASVIGYVASWQWELPGAIIQVGCGIAMYIFMNKMNESFLGLVFGIPFVFTGLLLIYSWVMWKIKLSE